ncbi:putative membrane protein [Pseudarthrobacter siccitolerans]|uniref:Putative membrane protein n=1 Tax=Pseudarthrobacter siccitolerans TaxID=861266 RepID=A0A024GXI2_9MICC|nr:putative membrane protein [Pseudarthrobacter siccitolerans]
MAKKRRSTRRSEDSSTTAIVAAMTPLVYVMAYAIITVLK